MLTPETKSTSLGNQLPIAILLATFNGEDFLSEQLDSIAAQTYQNWVVYVSDDGSVDSTLNILRSYQNAWGRGRMYIMAGPQQGFARNFMSLVRSDLIDSPFFAFCDQDDIWFPDKLSRALEKLSLACESTPSMFCSRTRLVDERGHTLGLSPAFKKQPCFRNALVQSIAGANTMVFNRAARNLLSAISSDAVVVSHDWLTYLLVAGCGGRVFYDLAPTLDYRQHDQNLVGTNTGIGGRLVRARKMLAGTFSSWNEENLKAMVPIASHFTQQNQELMFLFRLARQHHLLGRLKGLWKSKVYHQTFLGNVGLLVAAMLGRL